MLRRHLVRGYNEKVFYAESSGNAEKIFQIEFHGSKANEITKKEIFQLAGSWLVAFEADGECIENETLHMDNTTFSLIGAFFTRYATLLGLL